MVNANENMPRAQRKIQWHPAFCAAAEIELYQNRKELEFKKEYNLSQKPLQIDLLIVEKRGDVQIENEIGHIFRKHNIVEYKPPEDGKRRVAAYARVSTNREEQQNSYEAQIRYYTSYIKEQKEWEFAGMFSDEGFTGTSTEKRKGFNAMLQKALDGEIDLILTKSVSRFARNTVDSLTDLLNRGSFDRVLDIYVGGERPFAMILVDVDTFKSVNDTYGHSTGDEILKKVADRLKRAFRTIDYVCRIGGDEFAIIMVEMTSSSSFPQCGCGIYRQGESWPKHFQRCGQGHLPCKRKWQKWLRFLLTN